MGMPIASRLSIQKAKRKATTACDISHVEKGPYLHFALEVANGYEERQV